MHRPERQLILALFGVVFFDALLMRSGFPFAPGFESGLVLAIFATQVGLSAAWLAIGTVRVLPRLVTAIVMLVAVWTCLAVWRGNALQELGPLFLSQGATAAGTLFVMRWWGFRLAHYVLAESLTPATAAVPQFSIRNLMVFTFLVAIVLTALMKLELLDRSRFLLGAAIGVLFGLLTVSAVWSALSTRHTFLPAILTCIAGAAVGAMIAVALNQGRLERILHLGFLVGAPTVFQVIFLLAARKRGYQFTRRPAALAEAARTLPGPLEPI